MRRTARTAAGVAVAVAVVLAMAGCESKPKPPQASTSPATASPSSMPSVDASAAAAGAAVLSRYRQYQAAYAAASTTSDYKSAELVGFLETPLKQNVVAHLLKLNTAGLVYTGTPQSNPKVSAVHLTNNPQTVVIEDCYDATNFRQVYKTNNSPVPVGTGGRKYIIVTTATNYGSRGWLFNESTSYSDRPC